MLLRLVPFFILVGLFLFIPKVPNVGDGAEYYAMAVAINTTHTTYATPLSWIKYDSLRLQETKLTLPPSKGIGSLSKTVDDVRQDDFAHFWLYSACAALLFHITSFFSTDYSTAFYFFHCILLLSLMLFANRVWPTIGAWAALILFACSPLLWYSNKIHSELFTFVCTAVSAACIFRRQYLWACLALAFATTQNLPWGAIVAVFFLCWFVAKRSKPIPYTDYLLVIAIALVCLIHPLYYLVRHGALTPQLLQGGASLAKHTTTTEFFAPLVDLDIGLFPNWPLGILLVFISLFGYFRRLTPAQFAVNACLTAGAILFLLFSQSRSENINSGSTINVSRYGLWYVGFLLPSVADLLGSLSIIRISTKVCIGIIFATVLAGANFYQYRPSFSNPQSYTKPTYISNFVQNHLPEIYNPPWEIFGERFGKLDEDFIVQKSWAVSTQSGRKMLIRPEFLDQYTHKNILGLESHVIPPARLAAYIAAHKAIPQRGGFVTFTNAELLELDSRPAVFDTQITVVGPTDDQFFGSGWWQGTTENRIAKSESANIIFNSNRNFKAIVEVEISGYAPIGGIWNSKIKLNDDEVSSAHAERFVKSQVSFRSTINQGTNTLLFVSEGIQSPAQVGENSDNRPLGTVFYRLMIRADSTH